MISVLVAVYNQTLAVRWLLESLREQDCGTPYEVLVCDDGSRPEMFEVMQDVTRGNDFDLRYIWQPDRGFRVTRSRNNAIRLDRGDLLVILDGDVIVPRDFLACHLAAHTEPRQLVSGPVKRVPDDPNWSSAAQALAEARAYDGPEAYPEAQDRRARSSDPWLTCLGANLSVPRGPDVWFDERYVGWGAEDRDFAYRLVCEQGYDVVYERAAMAYHHYPSAISAVAVDSSRIADFLANCILFRRLHPRATLATNELVRHCYVNQATGEWCAAKKPRDRKVDEVLDEAEAWMRERGRSIAS
jgi:cellulose synthase/poly-beta-1,6-N-acetylglucosamine synthase-like glycosyltransferase